MSTKNNVIKMNKKNEEKHNMKNYMKIDDDARQIIMDKTFYKNSRFPDSPEYAQLQAVRKAYPKYTPVLKKNKKPDHSIDRHKGLTYDFIEYFINKFEPAATRTKTLADFEHMKDIAKAHAAGKSYNSIKKWFLNKYPEVDSFIIEEYTNTEVA